VRFRNTLLIGCFLGLWCAGAALAGPLTLSFVPASQTVSQGPIFVDVMVSGFGPNTASAVGDFDLTVSYDTSIVSATGVTFGLALGDESLFEALTAADWFTTPGQINFAETSLLDSVDLIAGQAPLLSSGFVLAELMFDPAGIGTTPLNFTSVLAGDASGINIPLVTESGSITVVPEPGAFTLMCAGGAVLFLGRRRRWKLVVPAVAQIVTAVLLFSAPPLSPPPAPAPKASAKIPLKDAKDNATGVEYQVRTTNFPKTAQKAASQNLQTPITIYNTTNAAQRVIICATGITENLGANFNHMKIQMKLPANNSFTCEIPNAQNLAARQERLGAMGCRLITIPAKGGADGQSDASFVSGNDRTIPKFDAKKLPILGQFNVVGQFGGVGPTQTGAVGSGVAAGAGWGLVGGHPGISPSSGKTVARTIDDLYLHFILLQNAQLGFDADPNPPPARNAASFNCNKCFGMGPGGGGTGLEGFSGYHLEPLAAADRKNVMAVFANHWVKYQALELKRSQVLTASLNIYNDFTFFADGPTQAQYTLDTSMLPADCSVSSVSPILPSMPFTVSPQEVKRVSVAITCGPNVNPGDTGLLVLTMTGGESAGDTDVLSKHFLRVVAPLPCDVNADGSVDSLDIDEIMSMRGTPVGPGNKYDVDGDGIITVNDARACTLQCSLPVCAIPGPLQ
jgi:hypothetical protein